MDPAVWSSKNLGWWSFLFAFLFTDDTNVTRLFSFAIYRPAAAGQGGVAPLAVSGW